MLSPYNFSSSTHLYFSISAAAGIDRGVDAAALEDLRVDHAGAEHLYPALALAGGAACAVALVALNVHFAARLGEREVMGAEARDRVLAVEPVSYTHLVNMERRDSPNGRIYPKV